MKTNQLLTFLVGMGIGLGLTSVYQSLSLQKEIKIKAFQECLDAVSDPSSNWLTRKESIDYCEKETL